MCSMGVVGCSGQLVRSFLLAVKPQHAHISIHWPSSLQLPAPGRCVFVSLQCAVVELYSQASFLLNTSTLPAPVLLYTHTPKPSNVMRRLSLTKPPRPRSELQGGSFSASPLSLSCLTMQLNYERLNHTGHGCVLQL